MVTILIPPVWRPAVDGARRVEVTPGSLSGALAEMAERFPAVRASLFDAKGQVAAGVNLFVNGEHVRYRDGLATHLVDGDQVSIIPLITGGR